MSFLWGRVSAIVGSAVVGLGGAYAIIANPDSSRALLALSGILGVVGIAGAFATGLLVWVALEQSRPALRFRAPTTDMALSQRLSALIGQERYQRHPIKFWGVLTLNHRFLFGFMTFGPVEYDTYDTPTPMTTQQATTKQGEV